MSNQNKIRILKVFVIFLAALDILLFCYIYLYYLPTQSPYAGIRDALTTRNLTAPKVFAAAIKESVGLPVRIKIPIIGVDANVEIVDKAADGSMGVPLRPLDTAWYSPGPRPGEIGSATISGHLDWKNGATAVFENLHKLKIGDVITVQDDAGASATFMVSASKKYKAAADATGIFYSTDGKAHLNIITCAGVWNKNAKEYSERLVVFAEKITK